MMDRPLGHTLSGHVAADGRKLFFGKYRGIVMDNDDKDRLGRLQCVCPELAAGEMLRWAVPVVPYGAVVNPYSSDKPDRGQGFGFAFIPEIGTGVWLEFEGGDINRPLWVGVFFSKPKDSTGKEIPNIPEEVSNSQDPDTGNKDYPIEKVFKTERWSGIGTRRITLELDATTTGTPVWDSGWLGKSKYDKPKVTFGRDGNTDEGGKNVVDIDAQSRDLRLREDRDRDTLAQRDIIDAAGRNIYTFAGQNAGDGGSPEQWGYIIEHADNKIEMKANGMPGATDALRERLFGDAPNARVRLSSGLNPPADQSNPKEASADAANLTIKLTGEQYAVLHAALLDVVIKSGVDTYVRAANGLLVETSSANGASPRAAQLHYLGAGAPATGGPANESGRPSPYAPEGLGSRTFLRVIDERAVIAYNYHQHEVVVPMPDEGGGGEEPPDPDDPWGPIDIGDNVMASMTTLDYGTIGLPAWDAEFDNGLMGQIENIAGTKDATTTDETGTYGVLDLMSAQVDAMEKLLVALTGYPSFIDALIGFGIAPQQWKIDTWATEAASILTSASGGSAVFAEPRNVAGPKISATALKAVPVSLHFMGRAAHVPGLGGFDLVKSAYLATTPGAVGIPRNHKSSFLQTAEDIFQQKFFVNPAGDTSAGTLPLHKHTLAAVMAEQTGFQTESMGGYQGLPAGLPSTKWKCGDIQPELGYALTITSTPCPPELWQVQNAVQPPLLGAPVATFEGQTATRVSTEFARAN